MWDSRARGVSRVLSIERKLAYLECCPWLAVQTGG